MNIWPIPPVFVDGMRVSASGHLNALRASAAYLLGLYQSGEPVWARPNAIPDTLSDGWRRVGMWRGRKYGDSLAFSMDVVQDVATDRTIRLYLNDTILTPNLTVAAGSGTVTVSGSRSLSSLNDGDFYRLAVDITGGNINASTVDLTYLRETLTVSYPSLFAFDVGTPTAEQWQALSTTAEYLHDQLRPPAVTLPRRYLGRGDISVYTITNRTGTIYYRIRFRPPYRDENRSFSMILILEADGADIACVGGADAIDVFTPAASTTIVLKDGRFPSNSIVRINAEFVLLGTNSGSGTYTGCTRGYAGTIAGDLGEYSPVILTPPGSLVWGDYPWDYHGTVDISGLGIGRGNDYKLRVRADSSTYKGGSIGEVTGLAEIVGISEQPDDIGLPSWWNDMPSWSHADMVDGDGMQPIRDNLDALAGLVSYYNYPAQIEPHHLRWSVRRRRWLHYYCQPKSDRDEDKLEPTLFYHSNGSVQQVKLNYKPNEWQKHDLEGVKGLFLGDRYEIKDVSFAIEDDEL